MASEVGVTSKTASDQNACANRVRFEPCTAADAATVGQCGESQPCRRRRGPTRLPPVDGPSRGSRHEHTNVKLRKSPPQACCSCTSWRSESRPCFLACSISAVFQRCAVVGLRPHLDFGRLSSVNEAAVCCRRLCCWRQQEAAGASLEHACCSDAWFSSICGCPCDFRISPGS